jgi:hypothetical protein
MPAVSVDTFFACLLMVIVVVSAMAGAANLVNPSVSDVADQNLARRYEEISEYLISNAGKPSTWGQNGGAVPEIFGLARANSDNAYELDIDKASRLNAENQYAIRYADMFTSLGLSDVSFRLEIKPVFQIIINLTATFELKDETTYQFQIRTEKNGATVETELQSYVIADGYFERTYVCASPGEISQNTTIPNDVGGPALLVVFARSGYNDRIVSYGVYGFRHHSAGTESTEGFVKLSPLNYSLDASFVCHGLNLLEAYSLAFNRSSVMIETKSSSESATYEIPHFVDPSPTVNVLTGRNSTVFFVEWVAYPQVPLEIGADFGASASLSDVYAYSYVVTINSATYVCTIWLGGPRK